MKNIALSLSLLALTSNTFAEDTDEVTDCFPEVLIITGQYSPVENQQLTSSVSVITRSDIDNSQAQSLSELLKRIPGVWVEDQGGAGGLSTISLRGAESNYTLVLLDGVEVNDPTNTRGGAFNLNAINVESIHRIEIVRGAQSAIYGSDALAGVIHIITVDPESDSARTYASIGDNDFYSAGIQGSGSLNNIRFAAALNTGDSGEQVDGSLSKQHELIGKILWEENDHKLQWNYRLFDGEKFSYPEQSGGPLLAATDDLDSSEFKDQSSSLNWDYAINEKWTSIAKASWYQRDEKMHSPGISPYFSVPENAADTDFTRQEIVWTNRIDVSEKLWANIGLANKKEDGESQGYVNFGALIPTDFSLSRSISSGFINANTYLTPKLLVQASLRQDKVESHKDYNTHQWGLSYQFTDELRGFVNGNSGFKLPSFNALGHPLIQNPDLKSETVDSWDTGLEWQQDNLSTRIAYFKNEYKNLIDFDSNAFTNVNRPGVDTSGVETEINWQANEQLHLQLHASYIDIDVLESDTHLLGRPDVTYGAQVQYQFNSQWTFNLNYLSVDDRFAASQYSGDSVEETLPAYDKLDAGVIWSINENHKLNFKLANAAGENYQTDIGFPAPKHYWQLGWVGNWQD
jgi:vitamin B12 transporter